MPSLARRPRPSRRSGARGQSLVEFVLVVPILLILLLAVADFGRIFAAGIVIQAASRDGAEAAAQQYVQLSRGSSIDYQTLRSRAEQVACAESQRLLAATVTTVSGQTRCTSPAIAVCVHDASGASPCGTLVEPTPDEVANCSILSQPWPTPPNNPDAAGLPFVEVRICYPFSMLLNTDILPIGTIYLQQSSNFVAVTY